MNDLSVGNMAGEYFINTGFDRFAFVGYSDPEFSRLRYKGFCQVVEAKNTSCPFITREELKSWRPDLSRPLAVFVASDSLGQDVLQMCQKRGIKVPDQVAVLGATNNILDCEISSPPMSSISLPLDRIGAAAIGMLQDLIAQKPLQQVQVMFEPNFVILRQSSDIFAVSDPVLRDALDYIRDHAHRPIVVNDVCEHAGGNRRTMERKCLKYTGRTLHQQIRNRRVNIAKKLLIQTELSVEQIATKCGFAEQERLTEAFIREAGMPPSVFMKEHKMKLQ